MIDALVHVFGLLLGSVIGGLLVVAVGAFGVRLLVAIGGRLDHVFVPSPHAPTEPAAAFHVVDEVGVELGEISRRALSAIILGAVVGWALLAGATVGWRTAAQRAAIAEADFHDCDVVVGHLEAARISRIRVWSPEVGREVSGYITEPSTSWDVNASITLPR